MREILEKEYFATLQRADRIEGLYNTLRVETEKMQQRMDKERELRALAEKERDKAKAEAYHWDLRMGCAPGTASDMWDRMEKRLMEAESRAETLASGLLRAVEQMTLVLERPVIMCKKCGQPWIEHACPPPSKEECERLRSKAIEAMRKGNRP